MVCCDFGAATEFLKIEDAVDQSFDPRGLLRDVFVAEQFLKLRILKVYGALFVIFFTYLESLNARPAFERKTLDSFLLKSKIKSVESFLEKLPNRNSTFKNKVLITESQSHHKTSKLAPRAIVFSENGDLIFSFDGGGDGNPNSIQYAEWNPKSKDYEFYSINFKSGQAPVSKTKPKRITNTFHSNFMSLLPFLISFLYFLFVLIFPKLSFFFPSIYFLTKV